MKNEPIIAYNHLQEEQAQADLQANEARLHSKWRSMLQPVTFLIEITAIIIMLILMIEECVK